MTEPTGGQAVRTRAPIREQELRQLLASLDETRAAQDAPLTELIPHHTVRTFRAGDVILRVDMDPDNTALVAEAGALSALSSALPFAIAPTLLGAGVRPLGGVERRFVAYPWQKGRALTKADVKQRAAEVGALFATLHSARVFDLRAGFPQQRPMTLMEAFKKTSDQLRAWTLAREADGLGQDLLTLTLSDLQRAMRGYAMALDHAFLTARRRVLCHGRAEPHTLVRSDDDGLRLVAFDDACLGDAAEDLAALSNAAELDDAEEDALLGGYLDRLQELGRPDPRFVARFFARRMLGLLSAPLARLDRLRRVKSGEQVLFTDPVVAIEEESQVIYEELMRAINGLRALVGGMRPCSLIEVTAMGRLIAYEELILDGRTFRIALSGLPYAGKTEVGSAVARRLKHAYVNTSALGRALALFERRLSERGRPPPPPPELVRAAFDAGLEMRPVAEPPYYAVTLGQDDITRELHAGADQVRGAALLDDERVRAAIKDELARQPPVQGIVVEGHYSDTLLSGRVRCFHLTCDPAVRRARLMGHRDVDDEAEAAELLARLDESMPKEPDGAVVIDLKSRPAATGALEILWHLLPPGRRPKDPMGDLSGRAPLYS